VPNIGASQQFEQGIEPLQNPQDVGERTPIKNGFAVPMLVEKKEPNRIPDFEEIKDKVAGAFRRERAESQLEATARSLANGLNGAGDLKAAAERLGLEAKTQSSYRIGMPLGELQTTSAAEAAIFALKEGEVTKTPVKIGDDWVVVGATKRQEADLAEFAQQRDMLIQSAVMDRRSQVFEDYIQAAQARLENEGRIKIYNEVIAKLGGDEPAVATPQLPTSGSMPIEIPVK
jgi:parvulin-like peptidyl-prolyl isomerase